MPDEPDRLIAAAADALCSACADHCWDRLPAVVDAVRDELSAKRSRAGGWPWICERCGYVVAGDHTHDG